MSIVTEFIIPAKAFVLGHTLEKIPDLSIEVERLATHSREWVMPFLWAHSNDIEAVENALQEDSSIDEVQSTIATPTRFKDVFGIGDNNVRTG